MKWPIVSKKQKQDYEKSNLRKHIEPIYEVWTDLANGDQKSALWLALDEFYTHYDIEPHAGFYDATKEDQYSPGVLPNISVMADAIICSFCKKEKAIAQGPDGRVICNTCSYNPTVNPWHVGR